jgi:hypothetical protein
MYVCTHTRPNSEIQYAEKPAQEIASLANSFQYFSADQMENSATTKKFGTLYSLFRVKFGPYDVWPLICIFI